MKKYTVALIIAAIAILGYYYGARTMKDRKEEITEIITKKSEKKSSVKQPHQD